MIIVKKVMKSYSNKDPEMITGAFRGGVFSMRKSLVKDDLVDRSTDMDEHVSSENGKGKSDPVEMHLHGNNPVNVIPERNITGGIRMDTSAQIVNITQIV